MIFGSKTRLFAILFCVCCILSCKTSKVLDESQSVVIREITRIKTDTVISYIITPDEKHIVSKDTASFLENKYASSEAEYSGGFLTHTLMAKAGDTIYVQVPVEKQSEVITRTNTETKYIQLKADPIWKNGYFLLSVLFNILYILRLVYKFKK